jgi:DNA-binding LytR/AlgR family response regulator
MRVLIADDEPIARQVLRETLDDITGVEVVGEASTGPEALRQAGVLHPDVLLLDLQMPGMTGFQVAEHLPSGRPAVIFVTAYERHALEAFDAGATDYLLKPVRKERLEAALTKARTLLAGRTPAPAPAVELRRIVGRTGSDLHLLDLADVVAFQAEGDLVYVITANARYYSDQTLKALDQRLPERFQRVHRATIINTDHIRKISPLSSKRWLLRMTNGLEVIVSKRLAGIVRDGAW